MSGAGSAGATYAHSLSDITDRQIGARTVKQGWVLTLADGRQIVVESARLTAEGMAAAAGDTAIERIEPVILGSAGWVFSSHLRPGARLAAAGPADLRLAAVRVERRRVTTYNLKVAGAHAYFVGQSAAWVHNSGTPYWNESTGRWHDPTTHEFVEAPRWARGVPRPTVSDSKLNNIVRDLYKGDTGPGKIGSGSTADAIRYEQQYGIQVGGRWHTNKGLEYVRALEKWLDKNPNASASDRATAQMLLEDLANALAGN